ncbi:MAG: hypothetical protein Q4E35_01235 [Eubacteriales bacterium]|nr:hypothetical protein [Eubacteriales bacterium]
MTAKTSPLKAIKAKCLDCMGGHKKEVKLCPSVECPLWNFRNGHKPKVTVFNLDAENGD